jgi:hypothetical protein
MQTVFLSISEPTITLLFPAPRQTIPSSSSSSYPGVPLTPGISLMYAWPLQIVRGKKNEKKREKKFFYSVIPAMFPK